MLAENQITGTLPSEIGLITRMREVDFHDMSFSGTIPEEIYDLTSLDSLDLSGSELSGTLSTRIGRLTSLDFLRLHKNHLRYVVASRVVHCYLLSCCMCCVDIRLKMKRHNLTMMCAFLFLSGRAWQRYHSHRDWSCNHLR